MAEKHFYDELLKKAHDFAEEADKEFGPKVEYAISRAKEGISELEEVTAEEVDKLGEFLQRDIVDAAEFDGDLRGWLQTDLDLIENQVLDWFSVLVDHTRLELDRLRENAMRYGEWHTGEIAGIGTLKCKSCGELLHFHKSGHVPPCPKCRGTRYSRRTTE